MTGSSGFANRSLAVMFPGQGSQYVGMANDLLERSELARDLMAQADSILGYPLSKIMTTGSAEELNRTVHTQPAIFAHSMILWKMLNLKADITPVVAAGHSLGEYSALCASGVLNYEDALQCIKVRAESMDSAQPHGTCGMVAVIGVSKERVHDILQTRFASAPISIANYNSADQIVLSGKLDFLKDAADVLGNEKRCRCVFLPVSSAFHTDFMVGAADKLLEFLHGIEFKSPAFPVISNATAKPYTSDSTHMRKLLSDQITKPVLWHESALEMLGRNPDVFIEAGPGKVLSGLLKRIDRSAGCLNISSIGDIETFVGTNR